MSDRDALAALILSEIGKADHPAREPYVGEMDETGKVTIDGTVRLIDLCDAILARWRLVPIIHRDLCGTNELGIPHDRGSLADDGCEECQSRPHRPHRQTYGPPAMGPAPE